MSAISCGIDFGTSNSSVAVSRSQTVDLVAVEGNHVTIPSAIFYGPTGTAPLFGRQAVRSFFEKKEGRFMRSLKRVLGTSLMKQGTQINSKPVKFERIIGSFILNLREKTNASLDQEIENVVLGRPVHFVDNDKEADKRAQSELELIGKNVGFKYIDFQFEPIAAAFAHEVNVSNEKLALVVDLGGGTSDFTLIRISKKYVLKSDRSSDILANTGVRIGGNDFDKDVALSLIMPDLGYGSTYGPKNLEVPLKFYHDMSEWSKVNLLYTPKNLSTIRQIFHESHDKKKFGKLLRIFEQESGHRLLSSAEEAKINLTANSNYNADFTFLENDFFVPVNRQQFDEVISIDVNRIIDAAKDCLRTAAITAEAVDLVILTGGSTEVPLIQSSFRELFPNAEFTEENRLSSVALGLAYDSQRKFG
jgi:hypothetical chaperone protein